MAASLLWKSLLQSFSWFLIAFLTLSAFSGSADAKKGTPYQPTWDSIDSRPLPAWYDQAKLGIFIHWGVFSVPSYSSEWFWWNWQGQPTPAVLQFMADNYRPDFTYADFAQDFTAEFFEAQEWAKLFESSGAQYIVFVSKHHEGYTNWPSKYSFNWNSMAVGPNRDIVGELAGAVKNHTQMKFGLYHSLFEWFHPLYLQDKANNFTTQYFVDQKTMPELYELVNTYQPDVIWSDGDWEAPDVYWRSTEFLAWLYNSSPVKESVVTNDRWGAGIACHHGGFFTCSDRYNPGKKQSRKFENAMTIDKYSWGYRRSARLQDYLTMDELIHTFVITVSCGGNMLMNVGPTKDGMIMPIFQERLLGVGQWLRVNGEAIYASQPWTYQNDTVNPNVWYTVQDSGANQVVYAFVLQWPTDGKLVLGAPAVRASTVITLLGFRGIFDYSSHGSQGVTVVIPDISFADMPCQWAWVFKLTNVVN